MLVLCSLTSIVLISHIKEQWEYYHKTPEAWNIRGEISGKILCWRYKSKYIKYIHFLKNCNLKRWILYEPKWACSLKQKQWENVITVTWLLSIFEGQVAGHFPLQENPLQKVNWHIERLSHKTSPFPTGLGGKHRYTEVSLDVWCMDGQIDIYIQTWEGNK